MKKNWKKSSKKKPKIIWHTKKLNVYVYTHHRPGIITSKTFFGGKYSKIGWSITGFFSSIDLSCWQSSFNFDQFRGLIVSFCFGCAPEMCHYCTQHTHTHNYTHIHIFIKYKHFYTFLYNITDFFFEKKTSRCRQVFFIRFSYEFFLLIC